MANEGLTTPAGAVAQKDFTPVNFLQQLLGSRSTVNTTNTANINPLSDVIGSMGNMSPEEMANLVQSLTATSFNKNMAPVAAAMTSGMGARTAGNSGLQMAMMQMQQQAVQDAIAKISDINTQRGNVRGQAAGKIADATKDTTQVTRTGGAGNLDPTTAFLLQLGINKADKKGWLDWAKDSPTASTAAASSVPASVTPESTANTQAATFGPSTGGFGNDFAPNYSSSFSTGEGLFADVPNDPNIPVTAPVTTPNVSAPDLNADLPPMTVDTPDPSSFDWSWFADGGLLSSLHMHPALQMYWSDFADGGAPMPVEIGQNERDTRIERMVNSIPETPEETFRRIMMINSGMMQPATQQRSYVDDNFENRGGMASRQQPQQQQTGKGAATPATRPPMDLARILNILKGNIPIVMAPDHPAGWADGGYNDMPSNQFMSMDPRALYSDGGGTGMRNHPTRNYPRGGGYADGGAVNHGRFNNEATLPIRLQQPAYAYNPPNRAPSVRAPMPGDRGYINFEPNHGADYGFGVGYADGGITNDSHAPFGNSTNNFVGALSRVITPYADGGTVRNRNYFGDPSAPDTISLSGPARLTSDSLMTANVSNNQQVAQGRPSMYAHGNPDATKRMGATAANMALGGLTGGIYTGVNALVKAMGGPDGGVMTMDNLQNDGTAISDALSKNPLQDGVNADPIHALNMSVLDNISSNLASIGNIFHFANGGGTSKGRTDKGHPWDKEKKGELLADGGTPRGGLIKGPGDGTSDSIIGRSTVPGVPEIAVSTDEYIIPADVVRAIGKPFFDNLLAATHTPVRR